MFLACPARRQRQQPIFRGSGDVVHVFATVTDRDCRLVTTLTRDDFEVRDEGKPQPITLFDNTPQPIRLIVMLDVSGSMTGQPAAPSRRRAPTLRAAATGRRRACPRVRPRHYHQSFVHALPRPAPVGAAGRRLLPDAPTPLWRALYESLDLFRGYRRSAHQAQGTGCYSTDPVRKENGE